MVMNMGRDAEQGVVELAYRPTAGDFVAGLRERGRASRSARRQKWLIGMALVFAGVFSAVQLAQGEIPVFLPVWALVSAAVLLFLLPRLQGRQLLRAAQPHGEYRATVTDEGLTIVTDNSTTTVNWAAQPRYREGRDVFVLLSADRNATCLTVLPKRGLGDPTDADRLREILDRNATRAQ
ncbi:YcxB family protein [Streptomyces sp. NPDC047072]|uniref:YcxB family protein n=1 Tax=Streptomyces sp. NPDC047072 TaxID=3154809 RepID=UPI0033FCBDA4